MADEFNIDDDFDLDDELGSLDGPDPFSEEPTDDRNPVSKSLKDGAGSFVEEFTDDKLKTVSDIAEKALPKSLSKEKEVVDTVKNKLKDEYRKAVMDIKPLANQTLNAIEQFVPKNEFSQDVLSKLKDLTSDKSSSRSAEETVDEKTVRMLEETLGTKTDKEKLEQLLKDQIAANRNKSDMELKSIISANVEKLRKFQFEIANNYYRKSLELQYKSLFISKEQLSVLKVGMDTFKNQLESIVKNTGLPDIIKMRSSEAFKANLKNRAFTSVSDKIFDNKGLKETIGDNISNISGNIKDKITESLNLAKDVGDNASMISDPDMGMTPGKLAGSMAAGLAMGKLSELISKHGQKHPKVKALIKELKTLGYDPSKYMSDKADTIENSDNLGERLTGKLMRLMSDITKSNDDAKSVKANKIGLDDQQLFDGRAYTSLVKVIPGLLSKIYGEIKSIRQKDDKPEDNEIRYDYVSDTFKRSKSLKKQIVKEIDRKVSTESAYYLDQFINILMKEGGLKSVDDKTRGEIRAGTLKYILNNGTLSPAMMVKNGFLNNFKKSTSIKVKKALISILSKSEENPELLDDLNNSLNNIKSSLPGIGDVVDSAYKDGNIDLLRSAGIVKHDKLYNTDTVDVGKYSKILSDSVKKIKSDDLQEHYTKMEEELNKNKKDEEKSTIKDDLGEIKEKLQTKVSGNKHFRKAKVFTKKKTKAAKKKAKDIDEELTKSRYGEEYVAAKESINKNIKASKETIEEKKKEAENIIKDIERIVVKKELTEEELSKKKELEDKLDDTVTFIKENATKENAVSFFGKVKKDLTRLTKSLKNPRARKLYKKKITDLTNDTVETLNTKATTKLDELDEKITTSKKAFNENKTVNKVKEDVNNQFDKVDKRFSIKDKLDRSRIIGKYSILYGVKEAEFMYSNYTIDELRELEPAIDKEIEKQKIKPDDIKSKLNAYVQNTKDKFTSKFSKEKLDDELNERLKKFDKENIDLEDPNVVEEKIKETIEEIQTNKKEINEEEEESLRLKFFNSPEYKLGLVPDFDVWLNKLGFKRKFSKLDILKKTLKYTRALDRYMFKMLFKGIGKIGGLGLKGLKLSPKLLSLGSKLGIKTGSIVLGSVLSSFKELFEETVLGKDPMKDTMLGKTKQFFKSKAMSGIGKTIKGGIGLAGKGAKSALGATADLAGVMLGSTLKQLTGYDILFGDKKKKKNPFDKDGDGKRDGDWSSRYDKLFGKKKKDVDDKDIKEAAKDKSGNSMWMILLNMLGKGFDIVKGIGATILKIPKLLSSIVGLFGKIPGLGKIVKGGGSLLAGASKLIGKGFKGANGLMAKAGGKLLGKVGARLIPGLGWGLAAWDAGNIAYDMLVNDKSFLDATHDQFLGEDESEDEKKTKPVNRTTTTKPVLYKAKGEPVDSINGYDNLILGKNVNIDGLNPELRKNLYAMANEYNKITGKKIYITSGYRSRKEQIALKRKYGKRAAAPGKSTHEYGLAFDADSKILNELDNLGLMRKYGFTRPIGGEPWHVEPAGIQLDIEGAKRDPRRATELIKQYFGLGGEGWGTKKNVRKYSRNKDYQKTILESKERYVDNKPTLPKVANRIDYKKTVRDRIAKEEIEKKQSTNTQISRRQEIVSKKDTNVIRTNNESLKLLKESNTSLSSIDRTLKDSLTIQKAMLKALDNLSNLDNKLDINKDKKEVVANNVDDTPTNLPNPAIDLTRATF